MFSFLSFFQVDEDEPLFLSLINDLFPNIKLEKETYVALESAIDKETQSAGLICHPPWILKLIQVEMNPFFLLDLIVSSLFSSALRNSTCSTRNDDVRTGRCWKNDVYSNVDESFDNLW